MRFTRASHDLPDLPHRGRLLDARLHLLDRQMVDASGDPAGTVDDLALDGVETDRHAAGTPPPRVTGLMTGQVLLARILGGQPPPERMQSVPWNRVADVGIVVTLTDDDVVSIPHWREHWLRDHVIAHIPGGRRAAE